MHKDMPNILTFLRVAAIPVIMALVAIGTPAFDLTATLVFTLAAITDYVDGKLARRWRYHSDLGRVLDPIADKLLVAATLMMLVGQNRLSSLGFYPATVILLREVLVSGLREHLANIGIGLPVTRLAKWKTGFQMTAIGLLLAGDSSAVLLGLAGLRLAFIGEALLWIAAVMTVVTGWSYVTLSWGYATKIRDGSSG